MVMRETLLAAALLALVGFSAAAVAGDCTAGQAFDAGSGGTCPKCAIGKYSDTSGATSCKSCPSGKTSAAIGANSVGSCINCAAGKYESANACDDCPAGKYGDAAGVSSAGQCKQCAKVRTMLVLLLALPLQLVLLCCS